MVCFVLFVNLTYMVCFVMFVSLIYMVCFVLFVSSTYMVRFIMFVSLTYILCFVTFVSLTNALYYSLCCNNFQSRNNNIGYSKILSKHMLFSLSDLPWKTLGIHNYNLYESLNTNTQLLYLRKYPSAKSTNMGCGRLRMNNFIINIAKYYY